MASLTSTADYFKMSAEIPLSFMSMLTNKQENKGLLCYNSLHLSQIVVLLAVERWYGIMMYTIGLH